MTFKLRDGLVVGDQTVIDSNAKVTAQDLYYDGEFPSVRPTLHYNFTRPAAFPKGEWPINPLIFSRATSGTFIGSDGLIQTAAPNVPRYHYDPLTGDCVGLMLERDMVNYILYSEKFTDSSWTKINCSVSDNQVTAPDGTTTAASISATSTNGYVAAFNVASLTSNTKSSTLAGTVYAKANTTNKFKLKLFNILDSVEQYGVSVTFNLSGSGSVETVELLEYDDTTQPFDVSQDGRIKITKLANGWFKCDVHMINYNGNKAIGSSNLAIIPIDVAGSTGLYVWGAGFFNLRVAPLSYIKTNGASVAVAADDLSIVSSWYGRYPGVTSTWYNQAEGTISFEVMPTVVRNQNAESAFFVGYSASTSYYYQIPIVGGGDDKVSFVQIVNSSAHDSAYPSIGNELRAFEFNKFALSFDNTSPYYCMNGVNYPFPSVTNIGSNINYVGMPQIKSLNLSRNSTLIATNSIWKSFSYYNKKLSNAETLELTK